MEGLQMAQIIADLQSLQTAVRPPSPPSSSPSSSSSPALSPSSGTTSPDFHALASTTPASSPSIFSYIFCRPGLSTPPSSRPTTPPKSAESHAEVNTTAQDPAAARALLTPLDSKPAPASSAGTSAPQSRRGSGAPKFDRTGRRFVALPASRTPPLFSREGSSASMESYGGSGTSTPAGGAVTDVCVAYPVCPRLFNRAGQSLT